MYDDMSAGQKNKVIKFIKIAEEAIAKEGTIIFHWDFFYGHESAFAINHGWGRYSVHGKGRKVLSLFLNGCAVTWNNILIVLDKKLPKSMQDISEQYKAKQKCRVLYWGLVHNKRSFEGYKFCWKCARKDVPVKIGESCPICGNSEFFKKYDEQFCNRCGKMFKLEDNQFEYNEYVCNNCVREICNNASSDTETNAIAQEDKAFHEFSQTKEGKEYIKAHEKATNNL